MTIAPAGLSRVAVSEDEIAAYQRDGAVLIKGVLSADELALLEAGLEEVHGRPSAMFSRVAAADGKGETMVDQLPSARSPLLRRLIEQGPAAELAARMMRAPSAQLVLDQVFYKQAGHVVPTPWHQDTPFLRVRGNDMARVWLTCDPSPRDVTVQVVRGSHLWNVVFDTATMAAASSVAMTDEGSDFSYGGIGDARLPAVPDIEAHRGSFDILRFDVEPGDAVVFHGNILHGASGKAGHPHPRRAFATMWGGPELRHYQPQGHAMPLPGEAPDKAIPQGARIGDHKDAFPVYWRE
jgi:ectoine hydroxylase-related dioxygenase (phytanoyl-CoA dioxygenase family)